MIIHAVLLVAGLAAHPDSPRPGPDSARVARLFDALGRTDPVVCDMVADQLGKSGDIQLVTGQGTEIRDFGFNSSPKKKKNRELLDPKLRDALSHAFDRKQIIDVVFRGLADPRHQHLHDECAQAFLLMVRQHGDVGNAEVPSAVADNAAHGY